MYGRDDYYARSGSGYRDGGRDGRDSRYGSDRTERRQSPNRSSRGSYGRYDDRSPPRRRSPSPPRHSSSRYRSPSPGPSYSRHSGGDTDRRDSRDSTRTERYVPTAEDNRNILERMEKSFTDGPLDALKRSIKENIKVKVWTRNYKEVRGICTGFVIAFDKHWNIVMKDVDEVFLKPRKGKTPFLRTLEPGDSDLIPELVDKVAKEKTARSESAMESDKDAKESDVDSITGADQSKTGDPAKVKKKRRRKRKTPLMCKRHIPQLFVRGDNVVMVSLLSADSGDTKESGSGDEEA